MASEDLIVNGGFEIGNFVGWNAPCQATPYVGTCMVVSSNIGQAHTGNYSAEIGTTTYSMGVGTTGYLSQNITVPARSKATLSFWYRVDKGAKLRFYLQDAAGYKIQESTFGETPTWTQFRYEISPQYGGKSIILVLEGTAFSDLQSRYEEVNFSSDGGYRALVTFKQSYYPYIDDVSVIIEAS